MQRTTKPALIGATLGLVSIGITMALPFSEGAYRVYLYNVGAPDRFTRKVPNGFVLDHPPWLYDQRFGYVYPKGKKIHMALISKGRVTGCTYWPHFNNADGNPGKIVGDYKAADKKILVFGDSFTAINYDGIAWPLLLQERLTQRLGRNVHVVNFGRDGYGILQMFDLAAAKIAEWKPQLAIIAFITHDLARIRFWRTTTKVNGRWRNLVSAEPNPNPDLLKSHDTALSHPEATSDWCESMKGVDHPDRVLNEIAEVYQQRVGTGEGRAAKIATLRHSYLLARARYGDPFRGLPGMFSFPTIDYTSYAEDSRFMEGLQAIEATGVPYVLVHLARYEELTEGKEYLANYQEVALLRSLSEVTGKPILETTNYIKLPVDQPERLIMSPEDHHPSLASLHLYADAVAEMLVRNGMVK